MFIYLYVGEVRDLTDAIYYIITNKRDDNYKFSPASRKRKLTVMK